MNANFGLFLGFSFLPHRVGVLRLQEMRESWRDTATCQRATHLREDSTVCMCLYCTTCIKQCFQPWETPEEKTLSNEEVGFYGITPEGSAHNFC